MPVAMRLLASLARNRDASVAGEVAAVIVFLSVLITVSVDFGLHASAGGKLQRAANETANIGTQFKRLRQGMTVEQGDEVGVLFLTAREVAKPLDIENDGAVIVTSVANKGDGARVMWQERSGMTSWTSHVATSAGSTPVLPGDFSLRNGDSALFVEIFYRYQPYTLSGGAATIPLYRSAVFRPRFGGLTSLDP